MFRSATFKLTMWYLAIVMAISLCFSVVLYKVATSELDRGLRSETQRIYEHLPSSEGTQWLRSDEDYDSGAHRIFWRLALFNVIVLAGAGLTSYWLARRTLEPIEEAHEQQKRFTADVSHELRTPLTALRMESEVALMGKKAKPSELRKTIESNLEEVTKLEGLVNDLLRLAQLETDELRQNFTPVQGKDIIEAAIRQVRPFAKARGIRLTSRPQDFTVHGDRNSLVQMLVIFLDNSLKYSPEDTVVRVHARRSGGEAVITISDQGQGIDPIGLAHVFDRFYRADKSRTKDGGGQEGYGLGLSIAKMIADLHGAHIALDSKVGEGTTATITFPIDMSAEPNAQERHDQ